MNLLPEYTQYAKIFVGILAIVNPLGVIPVFLTLSADRPVQECKQIARVSATAVACILIIAVWAGGPLLSFFGISIPAFRTGGGLLILLMAIAMLHAKQSHASHSPEEAAASQNKQDIAVVPLAIPLMAGPGGISLVIIDAHQAANWSDQLILSICVVAVSLLVWLALRLAEPIGKHLGITGLNIATRIMGLLLSAIGVQMIASGLTGLFPGLA